MNALDRVLQRWRISKALRWVPRGARVLDLGCADGALFRQAGSRISGGVGLDRDPIELEIPNVRFIRGSIPQDIPAGEQFDVVTMLAVAEHIPDAEQNDVAIACARALRPGGTMVISVPSALVDPILHTLIRLRILHGMSADDHHGFDVNAVPAIYSNGGLSLVRRLRFQLGLNNLFVFRKQ